MSTLLSPPVATLVFLSFAFYLVLRPYLRARSVIRKVPAYSGKLALSIDYEGIRARREHYEAWYGWPSIEKVKQTSRLYLLYAGQAVVVIPKRSFESNEQLSNFRKIVKLSVANRAAAHS